MLGKLTIKNYALIDELEIFFTDKLNVITGETGAGKSIIMGALGLILGQRADTTVLVNKEKKCVVEGIFFGVGEKRITEFLIAADIDPQEELVIRREIAVNGKSRTFINDTPVNLQQLQGLSSLLVDLHQQFDSWELGEADFQLDVLDALANHSQLLADYRIVYTRWLDAKHACKSLHDLKGQLDREADYNQFQFDELQEAGFRQNELEEIDAELKMLTHAEGIKAALEGAYQQLQDGESPLVQQLKVLANQLQHHAGYHPDLPDLVKRLQSTQVELQDIAMELNHLSDNIKDDPQSVERMNERLALGYKLLKKHSVQTTNELVALMEELSKKLDAVQNLDEALSEKEIERDRFKSEAVILAKKISEGRSRQEKKLVEKVNALLARVGMPNARIRIERKDGELNYYGADAVEFLFNANVAVDNAASASNFQPVRKVASGGELSRLMLCIKSLVAQSIDLPTLIFDEIDTGISGEAARQVSIIMRELAAARQLICITHQPQIAGKADTHFLVFKSIEKDKVKTTIRRLNPDERITVIAKMLSGEKPTAAAIENAREMMGN